MTGKDRRNEEYWQTLTGESLKNTLNRKRNQVSRFRLMTRGEAFSDLADISRVKDLLLSNPDTIFWIPTRAWRTESIWDLVKREIAVLPNARIQASFDPSNSVGEWLDVIRQGVGIMFFGHDSFFNDTVTGVIAKSMLPVVKCGKTWKTNGPDENCSNCDSGCFNTAQDIVHLKSH
jgi:hypothetical protein|tara:strand:+ start:643 stop:1170 length:528 start_codon:yes stop_codon:yes gene_type:complete